MAVELDLSAAEIGRVERVETLVVVFPGILLRQQKRLCSPAVLVDGGQIETGVQSVAAATGEHYPMTVHVPVVIAVGVVAVYLGERARLSGLQVHQPLVALAVPDREIAIVDKREEHPLAIVAGARPGEALAHTDGIEQGIDLVAVTARSGVEGKAAEVVLLVLIVVGVFHLFAGHVINGLAIG